MSFSQEPIYNINKSNLYLLNYASTDTGKANINLDNSFEIYKNSKNINTTSLNFMIKTFGMLLGTNVKYDYQNIASFDAIIGYNLLLSRQSKITAVVNAGFVN